MLDVPGYFDFAGEVLSALSVADAAVLVVAANSGVEVGTEQQWERVRARKLPVLLFVNKMDRENVDFEEVVGQVQERFGRFCAPIQVPIGDAHGFKGVASLLAKPDAVPAEVQAAYGLAKERMLEAVAETDDALATKYLEEGTLSDDELQSALTKAVLTGALVPIPTGSASHQLGVKELLEAVVRYCPSPAALPLAAQNGAALKADPKAPLTALVFKTTADPYVGKLSLFRVYQGTFSANSEVFNVTKGQAERIGQVFVLRGKTQDPVASLAPRDIGAVGKLAVTTTGDTLSQQDRPVVLSGLKFPAPLYTLAVFPKSKADSDKLGTAMARLAEEDPSLAFSRDHSTGETLLSGQGDVHLDMAFQKAQRKFGVSLLSQLPRVPYPETITSTVQMESRYKQQSGGRGHFADIYLRLEPTERGKGVEFATEVTGGAVPKEFFPYVEKGALRACKEGVLAGFPVVDLRIVLYDGSHHPVDSAGMDFDTCGYNGFKKAFQQDHPILLEPIASVTVPDSAAGDVIGDFNGKRGRILGMTPTGDGTTVVEAEAPLTAMQRYALDLRVMTHGRGTFMLKVSGYEPLPPHLHQKVVEQAAKRE